MLRVECLTPVAAEVGYRLKDDMVRVLGLIFLQEGSALHGAGSFHPSAAAKVLAPIMHQWHLGFLGAAFFDDACFKRSACYHTGAAMT